MSDKTTTRRRFLAGSASLPVIMTIQSGAALAQESTAVLAGRCATADAEKPLPTLTSSSADEWVRREIQLVTLKVNDVAYTGPASSTFFRNLNNSAYYQYLDDITPPVPLGVVGVPVPGGPGVVETNVIGGTRYALVLVDGTGAPVGFAWDEGTGGQKLTGSCWTSFA